MEVKPAGFLVRLMAMIYDGLILIAIWIFTIVLLVTVTGEAQVGAWVQSLLFLECFAFFAYFWSKDGQTLGMLAWRLRIVDNDSDSLSGQQVLLRFVGALLGYACLFVGYFWILGTPTKRSWSDIFSKTHVVREARRPKSK